MKRRSFCIVAMSAMTIAATLQSVADAKQDVGRLVNTPLWQVSYVNDPPCKGEIWENNAPILTVLQVVNGGVLATKRQSMLDSEPRTKIIFVRTNRTYADGDVLANGYYRATGTKSYQTVSGAQKTVYAFEELSASEQREITAIRQDKAAIVAAQRQAAKERRQRAEQTVEFKKSKERIAAEEAAEKERLERERIERENAHELAKLNAEKENRIAAMKAEAEANANKQKAENAREMARLAREKEEQEKENRERIAAAKAEKRQADAKLAVEVQKERERYAADLLSALDFNVKHHYAVQRSFRKKVKIEIVDPLWKKLADFHAKQDWLGFLGALEEEEYDEFPMEKEIGAIVVDLKKRPFKVLIKSIVPGYVGIWSWSFNPDALRDNRVQWGKGYVYARPDVKSFEEVEGKECQIVLFAGKFYICDSNEGVGGGNKPMLIRTPSAGEKKEFNEKAVEEAEEWLILN